MAVVVFDPAAFKVAFPQFLLVPDARLTAIFNNVGWTILDNTDASIVVNVSQRSALLDLLVAHILTLYGWATDDGTVVPGSGTVGRVSQATEGSVSATLEYHAPASAGEAWFNQTPFGAMYWVMTAQFRSFRYVAAGRSGIGESVDYLSRGIGLQPPLAGNSGTPGGM